MEWFERDFNHPLYFDIYRDKAQDARQEGPALAHLLGLPSGSVVMDLPCGWGRLHFALADKGYQVVGGDLSWLNLLRHQQSHPKVPLVALDLRRLPFRTACADGVFCAFTSWGYFATEEENQGQLKEFARLLKPGGVLLLDLTGRRHLEQAIALYENRWYRATEGYQERLRWSPDKKRIWVDRIMARERFRHDIWIPTWEEVIEQLRQAGLGLDKAYGGLQGEPWQENATRWIVRAVQGAS